DRQPRTAFTATSDADRAFAADRRLDRQLTPSTQATTILTPTGRILIGAPLDDDAGFGTGAAYVFRYDGSTWVEEQKLLASDMEAFDYFGSWVSLSGNLALIGGPGNNDAGVDSGSAYIFRHDGSSWVEVEKLVPSDGEAYESFGSYVSLSGDLAAVGAITDDDLGSLSGSAYLFPAVPDLTLVADPTSVSAGESLRFEIRWGASGDRVGLAVTEVGGVPTFALVLLGTFDSGNRWIVSGVVPPGLAGLVVTCRGYGLTFCGRGDATEGVTVTFL
ncbi:MAG: FG-GAP repeat protein, partial [Planctomycetota bacterium]